MLYKRIFVIVTDSMGIGEAVDASKYNDLGSNTFGHIADLSKNFNVPTLEWLGIGNICKNTKPKVKLAIFPEQKVRKNKRSVI
mgnify:CR=1 FL=1